MTGLRNPIYGNHETFGGTVRKRTLIGVLRAILRRAYNGYDWREAARKSDEAFQRRELRKELRRHTDGRRVL